MKKYDIYYIYDDPVPYKTILIYPITMRKYFQFITSVNVLIQDKNSIPDVKVISMTYLEYLYKFSDDKNFYIQHLNEILKMCLKKSNDDFKYGMGEDKKPIIKINDVVYNSDDFDEIRKIICDQNNIDIPDERISKEIRDKLDEAKRIKSKLSENKMASLEEILVCISIATGMSLKDIYDLTIRKYNYFLERIDKKLHYEIYLQASMSGFVTFKDKSVLRHWMSDRSSGKSDNMISVSELEGKIDEVNNK